ncbi:MAG: hypothetical protein KME13_22945 [Myxacorys californica WJT36-NPBG1]|jgi:hypothetical protein|nr:hypothetical protein [Myxacorys californica WJT36-NPBG1]
MLTRFFAWVLAALILLQNLVVCTSAQAATILTASTTTSIEAANRENTKILTFSDSEAFYKELAHALKSKTNISINTPFNRYEDFPTRLKEVFQLQQTKPFPPASAIGAVPLPSSDSAYHGRISIHYGALVSAGASTAIGAGIGGASGSFVIGVGAVPGALAGAGIGLTTWAVSQAIVHNCHKVAIKIGPDGSFAINIEPVCPFLA